MVPTMGKRRATLILLLILSFVVVSFLEIRVVKAEPKTIIVPDDYASIQEAIGNASEGDSLFVKSGTYNEVLLINKSLSLVGENKATTIINGHNEGPVILIRQNGVNVTGFTVLNGDSPVSFSRFFPQLTRSAGIHLLHASHCNIIDNKVENSGCGIWFYGSHNNTIIGNKIKQNDYGVRLESSANNMFRNNTISNSLYNFYFDEDFVNHVDASNTVDAKPIYYWVNRSNAVVPPDAGYVILVNCTGITVQGLNINNNHRIFLFYTQNSTIVNNRISNSTFAIYLYASSNNKIGENNITNNEWGGILLISGSSNNYIYGNSVNSVTRNGDGIQIVLSSNENRIVGNILSHNAIGVRITSGSENNSVVGNNIAYNDNGFMAWDSGSVLYNNNFVYNTITISNHETVNVWDDGIEGNYWSDYEGADNDGDGIGDIPFVIDKNNQDNYPLIEPYIIPEFPSWTPLVIMLFAVTAVAVIYRRSLPKPALGEG